MSVFRTVILAAAMAAYSFTTYAQPTNGFAVVELFTSEGCSSCPAAEKVLAQIHDEYKQNVYALEFHVDYWNYLGWKDVFSDHAYSLRQQQYVSLMHLNSAYTPQAIVNGKQELVGSDKPDLEAKIKTNLSLPRSNQLHITANAAAGNVSVYYTLSNKKDQILNIAVVQKATEMNVRKGENSGRTLKHTNVVRSFKVINSPENAGTVTITLPAGLQAKDCTIVAYTQQKDNWNTTAAAGITL